ncbi:GtrA family protein [Candidatus Saccharibacteria bacterium TM7i]|nr:GtrA family protein [Candidatus Saccharibacteria bacterium TM7i]
MKTLIKTLLANTAIRYLLVGGFSFVFEIFVLWLLSERLSTTTTVAVGVSFWIGLIASFLLQKFFAFNSGNSKKEKVFKEVFFYAVLVLFNYLFTLIFVAYFTPLIDNIYITRGVALAITVIWNFFVYKYIIFSKKSPLDS